MTMGPVGPYTSPPRLGKYKGFVRDNQDPEKRGRIRCYCPQIMGATDDKSHWLGWALPNFPWLGGVNTLDFGSPLTKDQNNGVEVGVWLEFEGGDTDFPIWCGTWIPAPDTNSPNAQIDLTATVGDVGGSIVGNPPAGSSVADINPPKPIVPSDETRLVVKAGRELVLMSDQGGSITIGAYGVNIQGANVTINGKNMLASPADGVVG